jgi:hypothetical protein
MAEDALRVLQTILASCGVHGLLLRHRLANVAEFMSRFFNASTLVAPASSSNASRRTTVIKLSFSCVHF